MASAVYPLAKQAFLSGGINLTSDDIRVMLVKSTYTYSAAHQYVSDISTNDNGRSAALSGKSVTNGVFNASNTTLTATAASASNALVVYKYNAADASAQLIAYIDTGTGLPFTPSASQTVSITWDTGANKIFAL